MATRPATAPEMMPSTLGLPRTIHSVNIHARRGGGGGDLGDGHGHAGAAVSGELGTGVEAEPADPQQRGADDREHQVVRRHVLGAEADALAEDEGADQAGDTGVDVHDRAAGEISTRHRR